MNKKELTEEQIKEARALLEFDISVAELEGYEMSEEEKMLNFALYAKQISEEEYSHRYSMLVNGTDFVVKSKK